MEQQKQKSLVQFVRRSLGHKGMSQHSGRGSYDCDLPENVTWQRIKPEILKKAAGWKKSGKAVEVKEELIRGVECITIRFDPSVYGSYNVFYINQDVVDKWHGYTIQFTMDSFNSK